ncbi:NHLP bacteriocin system secretion protein [Mesorhizobium sp. M0152]|uniref:NHLP bacteriocin system secretion protein n=1 Tax=unclassified Mesorhizobium TaxID=325217 RepID=UPI00333C9E19
MLNPVTTSAESPRALRDPEHLNQAIQLTSRSTWILFVALALCVSGAVAWGFVGRLAFHAKGQGVILLDRSVVADVVARTGGTVAQIHVKPGDTVTRRDLLVTVKLDEVAERLEQARIAVQAQRGESENYDKTSHADVERRRQTLHQEISSLKASLADAEKNRQMIQGLYEAFVTEVKRGFATRIQEQLEFGRLIDVQRSIRQMTDQIQKLQTEEIEFEDLVHRSRTELRIKVIDAEASYRDLQVQFEVGSAIRSPVDGTVSEITTYPNATVAAGINLITVESSTLERRMIVHAYLPIDQGKRVVAGMHALISPSSIDEQIYGSIKGQVSQVSLLPVSRGDLLAVLGNEALVDTLMGAGAPVRIEIELEADPDTTDGLHWTSAARPLTEVTPGTTAAVNIVVDRVTPLSLVLPIVRTWAHL